MVPSIVLLPGAHLRGVPWVVSLPPAEQLTRFPKFTALKILHENKGVPVNREREKISAKFRRRCSSGGSAQNSSKLRRSRRKRPAITGRDPEFESMHHF